MKADLVAATHAASSISTWSTQGLAPTKDRPENLQAQLRVSVVDDDPAIAVIVGSVLEESGFSVTVFTDPNEALTSARLQPPHIVVTDLNMPFMSGIELCDQLRGEGVSCGMVLFSGALSTVSPEQLAMLPGVALLNKPSNPLQIVSEVSRIAASTSVAQRKIECGLIAGIIHNEIA